MEIILSLITLNCPLVDICLSLINTHHTVIAHKVYQHKTVSQERNSAIADDVIQLCLRVLI